MLKENDKIYNELETCKQYTSAIQMMISSYVILAL